MVLAGEQGQRVTGQSVVVLSMRHPAVSGRVGSPVASLTPVPERGGRDEQYGGEPVDAHAVEVFPPLVSTISASAVG